MISIVVPAYNEGDSIALVVRESLAVLDAIDGEHEVVVVDDASADDTPGIVEALAQGDTRVRLIRQERNQGAARSWFRGMLESKGDFLFFLPADFQIHPNQIHPCLDAIREADYVCTHRVHRADPWHRKLMSGGYNLAARLVLGLRVHDVDSVFMIRRAVLDAVASEISSESDFISVELLVRAQRRGFRVTEVQIDHLPRIGGQPRALTPSRVVRTLVDLALSIIRMRRLRRSAVGAAAD